MDVFHIQVLLWIGSLDEEFRSMRTIHELAEFMKCTGPVGRDGCWQRLLKTSGKLQLYWEFKSQLQAPCQPQFLSSQGTTDFSERKSVLDVCYVAYSGIELNCFLSTTTNAADYM